MLQIDFSDRRPIYEQIKSQVKNLIVHRVLKEGDQLPSVRELAQTLTINPNTIQKAYRELEMEGFICSVRGKGNFVSGISGKEREKITELFLKMERLVGELRYLGVSEEQIETELRRMYEKEGK